MNKNEFKVITSIVYEDDGEVEDMTKYPCLAMKLHPCVQRQFLNSLFGTANDDGSFTVCAQGDEDKAEWILGVERYGMLGFHVDDSIYTDDTVDPILVANVDHRRSISLTLCSRDNKRLLIWISNGWADYMRIK